MRELCFVLGEEYTLKELLAIKSNRLGEKSIALSDDELVNELKIRSNRWELKFFHAQSKNASKNRNSNLHSNFHSRRKPSN